MARVITFSRIFPAYHTKKGEPTYFVEKFWNSLQNFPKRKSGFFYRELLELNPWMNPTQSLALFDSVDGKIGLVKNQTIRSGNRWKVGDYFSPRVWSGKPYNSKQIIIGTDTKIEKVFDFKIREKYLFIDNNKINPLNIQLLASNDGLTDADLLDWFKYPKEFTGQIICWSPNINY